MNLCYFSFLCGYTYRHRERERRLFLLCNVIIDALGKVVGDNQLKSLKP